MAASTRTRAVRRSSSCRSRTTRASIASRTACTTASSTRLERAGAGPILDFETYQKGRVSGLASPVVGLAKGDIIRIEVQDARDAQATAEAKVAAHRRALDEARRRLASAEASGARVRARTAVEEAERALARAERERATSVFARANAPAGGGTPLIGTLEVQFQLHDPAVGRDIVAEPIVRSAEGTAAARSQLEDKLIDEAVEPIAVAIEARFYDINKAARQQLATDALKQLDQRIAALEKRPDAGGEAAAAVLEATGYSYGERRTLPNKLTLE
jgi:hypothetical protein